MNRDNRPSRIRQACMIATRICLVVSLWQAPIPWFHCHGTNLGQPNSVASALRLSSHLADFHATLESNTAHDLGWHFHWVLPCWNHTPNEARDDEPPGDDVAFDPVTISPWDSTPVTSPFVAAVSISSEMRFLIRRSFAFQIRGSEQPIILRQKTLAVLRC